MATETIESEQQFYSKKYQETKKDQDQDRTESSLSQFKIAVISLLGQADLNNHQVLVRIAEVLKRRKTVLSMEEGLIEESEINERKNLPARELIFETLLENLRIRPLNERQQCAEGLMTLLIAVLTERPFTEVEEKLQKRLNTYGVHLYGKFWDLDEFFHDRFTIAEIKIAKNILFYLDGRLRDPQFYWEKLKNALSQ